MTPISLATNRDKIWYFHQLQRPKSVSKKFENYENDEKSCLKSEIEEFLGYSMFIEDIQSWNSYSRFVIFLFHSVDANFFTGGCLFWEVLESLLGQVFDFIRRLCDLSLVWLSPIFSDKNKRMSKLSWAVKKVLIFNFQEIKFTSGFMAYFRFTFLLKNTDSPDSCERELKMISNT